MGLVPGVVTASLVCTLIQYLSNEASIARIKFVARAEPQILNPPSPAIYTPPPAPSLSPPPPARSFSQRVMDAMTVIAPVKRLTDEEYLALMEKQQAQLEEKLKGVQKEMGRDSSSERPPQPNS